MMTVRKAWRLLLAADQQAFRTRSEDDLERAWEAREQFNAALAVFGGASKGWR